MVLLHDVHFYNDDDNNNSHNIITDGNFVITI